MSGIPLLGTAAAGMAAERDALDVLARNVAAAQAAGPSHPYRRLVAQFALAPAPDAPDDADPLADVPAAIRFTGTLETRQPADTLGELIAVLDTQRAYEADAAVFDVGKRLAERTLDLEQL